MFKKCLLNRWIRWANYCISKSSDISIMREVPTKHWDSNRDIFGEMRWELVCHLRYPLNICGACVGTWSDWDTAPSFILILKWRFYIPVPKMSHRVGEGYIKDNALLLPQLEPACRACSGIVTVPPNHGGEGAIFAGVYRWQSWRYFKPREWVQTTRSMEACGEFHRHCVNDLVFPGLGAAGGECFCC